MIMSSYCKSVRGNRITERTKTHHRNDDFAHLHQVVLVDEAVEEVSVWRNVKLLFAFRRSIVECRSIRVNDEVSTSKGQEKNLKAMHIVPLLLLEILNDKKNSIPKLPNLLQAFIEAITPLGGLCPIVEAFIVHICQPLGYPQKTSTTRGQSIVAAKRVR